MHERHGSDPALAPLADHPTKPTRGTTGFASESISYCGAEASMLLRSSTRGHDSSGGHMHDERHGGSDPAPAPLADHPTSIERCVAA